MDKFILLLDGLAITVGYLVLFALSCASLFGWSLIVRNGFRCARRAVRRLRRSRRPAL